MSNSSQLANAILRRYGVPEHASRIDVPDGSGFLAERSTQTPEPSETDAKSLPETRPAMVQPNAIWASVYWIFLDGFALYGASVHGLATGAVTTITSEVDALRPRVLSRERRKSISLVSAATRAEMAVLESEGAVDRIAFGSGIPSTRDAATRAVDRYRFVHPGWLNKAWRAIASRWVNWRREREINKAVAALAEYDDRMLRDMGFPSRSQIEQIVRNGRDD